MSLSVLMPTMTSMTIHPLQSDQVQTQYKMQRFLPLLKPSIQKRCIETIHNCYLSWIQYSRLFQVESTSQPCWGGFGRINLQSVEPTCINTMPMDWRSLMETPWLHECRLCQNPRWPRLPGEKTELSAVPLFITEVKSWIHVCFCTDILQNIPTRRNHK